MLKIENLTKSYENKVVFKKLNLEINNGEVLSIVGPSGIGKTTLLKIIAGLCGADSGKMVIDGQKINVTEKNQNALIGVIFQDFNLFPQYTVLGNITLAPRIVKNIETDQANSKAKKILDELGIGDKADLYPYQLSGGQKQRVAIARALAMEPKILAYDEPTSALDEFSTGQVVEVIKELKKRGVTQMVITHDMSFAKKISDRIFDFKKEIVTK
ncbi:amino acid ABC transporter ATP-binding protein [Oenococcus oeni]|uniref:Transporter subunit: ATP-binding component of ABC superfamily transporter n=1 Tax=Oenococcus oeni TaxID=1247 RepID=A0AAQ2UWX5_OENOE|nr:ATP-binding cassette domain-containing protein [Oenococcus oeni]KGI02311.1 polar amino acid ABC transporter ATPase [Oenococcus oeni IOEB_C52]OIK56262.1 polar amino acid ABC transporter ATP-binding protein [Oenococcus oeni]OIM62527.1 polar amino acid ABC transporter ATP-binding protein [Oenococcus oeni]OLQ38934.1 polar amino acid ABC transporter ATP-binding protein [Oenococcus oeni]SYW06950.1 putative transporter subunit: ATP-binding component of ABC superfamily transporter [Oenococcus oeni]